MAIINSSFRLTGLASGLDTDQMVKDLMKAERIPLTKLEQKKQLAEWRQDAYREFTNALRGFKEKFFDVTKRTSYLLSDNAFKVYSTKSSSDDYVTARGTSSSEAASHTVKVLQLATADKIKSENNISKAVTGTVTDFKLEGKTINITLDGVTREITLSDYDDMDDLVNDPVNGLQKKLDDAFGTGFGDGSSKIIVSSEGDELQLSTANGATKLIVFYGANGPEGLDSLGITTGSSNRIFTNNTLVGLQDKFAGQLEFDEAGNISFDINGESFTFSQNDTLIKVMDTINNSAKANVRVRYDETTDEFTITAKQTGAGDNIRIHETAGSFFAAIGIDSTNPVIEQGQDAIAEIDGVQVTRSSNTFTVNGLEYTIKKEHATESAGETITVEPDVDAVYDSIKAFVDEYNKLVDQFTTKLTEKYDRNFQPLSEEEKEALGEDEVKKWEDKAKTGLLRNDSMLQEIQTSMRMALIERVEDVGIDLSSIGITSKSYTDRGKLYIDETKLKEAIREKPDEVKNLFIKRSDSVPTYSRDLTTEQRSTRNKEQGLLFRLSDILDDNISIIRDKDGRKGILLEKAGMEGDTSDFDSSLAEEIDDYNDRISEMLVKLARKEENYYREFSRLETYMNQMNSQMNWLTSQMGGSTG